MGTHTHTNKIWMMTLIQGVKNKKKQQEKKELWGSKFFDYYFYYNYYCYYIKSSNEWTNNNNNKVFFHHQLSAIRSFVKSIKYFLVPLFCTLLSFFIILLLLILSLCLLSICFANQIEMKQWNNIIIVEKETQKQEEKLSEFM